MLDPICVLTERQKHMQLTVLSVVCTLIVLFSGCATQPKRQCYDMTIGLGYNGMQTQRICTIHPQTESEYMKKVKS